jgi:hypothetical protein
VTAIDDLIPPDATLGFRFVLAADKPGVSWDDQRRRAQLYQFALPHHLFLRDRGVNDGVGPYVFAPTNDKILQAAGGKILWTDPKVKVSQALDAVAKAVGAPLAITGFARFKVGEANQA